MTKRKSSQRVVTLSIKPVSAAVAHWERFLRLYMRSSSGLSID